MKTVKTVKRTIPKMQNGGSKKDKWGRSSDADWYGFDPKTKKWTGDQALSAGDLKALAHQKRGMGSDADYTYVKKSGPIKNELGSTTPAQRTQLRKSMAKASTLDKIYEGAPNIGRMVGKSAADISKKSILQKQKNGGTIMYKKGGALKKVDKAKNPGLNKLPKEVKNKMGYMKKGGSIKKKM